MAKAMTKQLGEMFTWAEEHGKDSDPDMEVGDLQEMLKRCWAQMNAHQRQAVYEQTREELAEEE